MKPKHTPLCIAPALTAAIFASALVTAPPTAHAQIVNTQPLLSKIEENGLSGDLRTSFEWRTGNVELLRLSASALLVWRADEHALVSSSSVDFGQTGTGDRYLFRTFSHLRYQLRASPLVTWEAYGQVAHDEFRRITLRALTGTGPRWTLFSDDDARLALGTAYMLEHERFADSATLADAGRSRINHRASFYLDARYAPEDHLALSATVYYQPRFDAWASDWLLFAEAQLAVRVLSRLALTFAFTIAYDATPPETVRALDTATNVGLAWTF